MRPADLISKLVSRLAPFMVPLPDSSDSETPPIVSNTCWAEMKLVAVSWTLEIPLNKYTEEMLDEIYKFIVDVSSVHALHASTVRAPRSDKPISCWQLRNLRS